MLCVFSENFVKQISLLVSGTEQKPNPKKQVSSRSSSTVEIRSRDIGDRGHRSTASVNSRVWGSTVGSREESSAIIKGEVSTGFFLFAILTNSSFLRGVVVAIDRRLSELGDSIITRLSCRSTKLPALMRLWSCSMMASPSPYPLRVFLQPPFLSLFLFL